jgi:sec-independent protein translocase protein TatB
MGPSFSDTIFLFVLALIIFGPKKLPEIARQIGKVMNELRRASNEFKVQIQQEMDHMDRQENGRQENSQQGSGRKFLAPSQPPPGAVAALSLNPEPTTTSEPEKSHTVIDLQPISTSEVSAPDAISEPSPDSAEPMAKVSNV